MTAPAAPSIRLQADGTLVSVAVRLTALYGGVEVPLAADGSALAPEGGTPAVAGDDGAQRRAVARVAALGLSADGDRLVATGRRSIAFWTRGLASLPDAWEKLVPDDLAGVHVRDVPLSPSALVERWSAGIGTDWLTLRLGFESEGAAAAPAELHASLAEERTYVRLVDGSFAPVHESAAALLDAEAALPRGDGGKIPVSAAGALKALVAGMSADGGAAGALFDGLSATARTRPPRSLKATLRPYQKAGLSWLLFLHDHFPGGILADDMGLGKTLQTIALLSAVKEMEKGLRALIVAPTSVVPNWAREIGRFSPGLKVVMWTGEARHKQRAALGTAEVILTSYPLLRRDELLQSLDFGYAILDEAQHIKSPVSATAQVAKKLAATHRIALTGTPIENRLSEFWSIFDFVSPGLLGTLDMFQEKYGRPIDGGDTQAATRLRAVIHPFILRRTKLEVEKDLPGKIETDHLCEMAPEQKKLYADILRDVRARILREVETNGLAKSQIHILAGLTRLRQAACDPRLMGLPRPFSDADSGKLEALRELLAECVEGGHKVLVFSQFVTMLKLIKAALDKDKIVHEYLDGTTKDRQRRVDRFQADARCTVFLISLKAGGTGLNLTAADTVVHFDPWWNPAVEDQATDRAHRIGQSRVVSVYRLVAQATIEEKILQMKSRKRELVASVLSEDRGGAKSFTRADIEDLFR